MPGTALSFYLYLSDVYNKIGRAAQCECGFTVMLQEWLACHESR